MSLICLPKGRNPKARQKYNIIIIRANVAADFLRPRLCRGLMEPLHTQLMEPRREPLHTLLLGTTDFRDFGTTSYTALGDHRFQGFWNHYIHSSWGPQIALKLEPLHTLLLGTTDCGFLFVEPRTARISRTYTKLCEYVIFRVSSCSSW